MDDPSVDGLIALIGAVVRRAELDAKSDPDKADRVGWR